MKKTTFSHKLRYWFPLAILLTFISGLVYVAVQQDLRITANDPQIQMAEDAVIVLQNGESPQVVLPTEKVDISQSLAPYMMIFDNSGKEVASSAILGNATPTVPSGVFQNVLQKGEDRFTWEPQNGVRSAVVVTHYNGGFVLVGRSLREVEKREASLAMEVTSAWVAGLVITFLATIVFV